MAKVPEPYFEVTYQEFLARLEEWGYDTRAMVLGRFNTEGYYRYVKAELEDGSFATLHSLGTGGPVEEFAPWKDAEHADYVRYAVVPLPRVGGVASNG